MEIMSAKASGTMVDLGLHEGSSHPASPKGKVQSPAGSGTVVGARMGSSAKRNTAA